MRRLVLALCCLVALPLPALGDVIAYDESRLRVTIGAFCAVETVQEIPAPDTAAGKIELFEETPQFEWLTARVPAVQGLSFGVKTVTLDGLPLDGVQIELTHPPFLGSGVTQQRYVTSLGGTGVSINAYSFDTAEEQVTGEWHFRASQNGRLLYHVVFNIVAPRAAPGIASACGMALSS